MSKGTRWINLEDLPGEPAQRLARAYDLYVDALYHTNNVIRYARSDPDGRGVLFVQRYQVSGASIRRLVEEAGVNVTVAGLAPGYIMLRIFGTSQSMKWKPPADALRRFAGSTNGMLYRPMKDEPDFTKR